MSTNPDDICRMTPKDHVFRSLKNMLKAVKSEKDLNEYRPFLLKSFENVISWEPLLINLPNHANSDRFKASRESIPYFQNLNNFLREKHKNGITFSVWVVEDKDIGPIIHYTAFPDYKPT